MNYNIIVKILVTILVIIMCGSFIKDLIYYIKQKNYFKIILGIVLIILYIYIEYNILTL
jgi:hypothetical protein